MTEHTYIRSVHTQLKNIRDLELTDVWKINDNWKGGCADAMYDGPANDLWVEYKFIKIPKRPTTLCIPALSEQQNEWLTNRYNNGRNVAVIVGSNKGAHIFLTPGSWSAGVTNFLLNSLSKKEIAYAINSFIMTGQPLPATTFDVES